jgi:hypothetical protein
MQASVTKLAARRTRTLAPTTYNYAIRSVGNGSEQARQESDVRLVVDTIPDDSNRGRPDLKPYPHVT